MCSGTEAGSYLTLIDSCITQLKAQGPSRTCNESKEEEKTLCVGGSRMNCRVNVLSLFVIWGFRGHDETPLIVIKGKVPGR